MSTNETLRFAVIGAGVIGDVHSHALTDLDGVELVAIADVKESKAAAMAGRYAVPTFTADVEALLHREDIDAVTVCTPSGVHADVAVAALTAGKHTSSWRSRSTSPWPPPTGSSPPSSPRASGSQ